MRSSHDILRSCRAGLSHTGIRDAVLLPHYSRMCTIAPRLLPFSSILVQSFLRLLISPQQMGSRAEALAGMTEAIRWAPNEPDFYERRGILHRQAGECVTYVQLGCAEGRCRGAVRKGSCMAQRSECMPACPSSPAGEPSSGGAYVARHERQCIRGL